MSVFTNTIDSTISMLIDIKSLKMLPPNNKTQHYQTNYGSHNIRINKKRISTIMLSCRYKLTLERPQNVLLSALCLLLLLTQLTVLVSGQTLEILNTTNVSNTPATINKTLLVFATNNNSETTIKPPAFTDTTTATSTSSTTTVTDKSTETTTVPISYSTTIETGTSESTPQLAPSTAASTGSQQEDLSGSTSPIPTVVEVMGSSVSGGATDSDGRPIASKLPKVNFTLVEETFQSVLDDDEVIKKWKNMDSQLQNGIRSILKLIFPQIVSISQDAKVSGDCSGGILRWILSLRNLRNWAVKMLDAVGKPSAGIFEGALTMFGNYRQCLSIRAPDDDDIESSDQFEEYFRGQYCIIHLKPWLPAKKPFYGFNSTIEQLVRKGYPIYEKTLYDELAEIAIAFNFIDIRFDLCVPSTCTPDDIQRVTEHLTKKVELRTKVVRCDVEPKSNSTIYDRSHIIWASICLLVLTATIASTIFTIVHKRWIIGRHHTTASSNANINDDIAHQSRQRSTNQMTSSHSGSFGFNNSRRRSILSSMSITRSLRHYTNIDCDVIQEQKPAALYGLRTIFVYWFMLVQMTVNLNYQFLRESQTLRYLAIQYWPMQILINSTMQYDSIILITAFTFAYYQFDSTIRDHLKYALDKYVRLLPSILFMVAITILTPLIYIKTPVWRDFADGPSSVCKSNGYISIFFLQNFISYNKMCLPQTWLVCVELQLVFVMIPLVILLKRNFYANEDNLILNSENKFNSQTIYTSFGLNLSSIIILLKSKAGIVSIILISLGWLCNFLIVYINELPPTWFYSFPDAQQKAYYFGYYFYKTWTHLSTFILGILAGHLCKSTSLIRNAQLVKFIQTSHSSSSSSSANFCTSHQNHRKLVTPSIWLATAACIMAIIFSTYSWSTQTLPTPFVSGLFDATSRCLWAIALIVIMINISLPNPYDNQYNLLARILSHKIMIALGRLSFLAYLIYPYVHSFVLSVQEQALYPSLFLIFHVFVGNIIITLILAFLLSITIEQPVRRLITKCFLGNRHCNQKINISTQLSGLTTRKVSSSSLSETKISPQLTNQTITNIATSGRL